LIVAFDIVESEYILEFAFSAVPKHSKES